MADAELRELLELAAKAAGIDPDAPIVEGNPYMPETYERLWAPHTDDGDSRRLQVALRIETRWAGGYWIVQSHDCASGTHFGITGRDGGDDAAALRLAVLRAAADIGRAMSKAR